MVRMTPCYKCAADYNAEEHLHCPNCYHGHDCEGCGRVGVDVAMHYIDGWEYWCDDCLGKRLRGDGAHDPLRAAVERIMDKCDDQEHHDYYMQPEVWRDLTAALSAANARIAALEAERDTLRAALEPFAEAYAKPVNSVVWNTCAACENAYKLLKKEPVKDDVDM